MQRPTVATVFGVLNIIFGAFALVCLPIALAGLFMGMRMGHGSSPYGLMLGSPGMRVWMALRIGVQFFLALTLIAAGIGLLLMKPWARALSVGYAICAIVSDLAGVALTVATLAPRLSAASGAMSSGNPMAAGMVGGMIGGIFGGCFALIYPILLLIFMTRPEVIQAFKSFPPPGYQPPPAPPYG